jgi:hypothetical protein
MVLPKRENRRHPRVPVAIRVFARDRGRFPEDTVDVSTGGFSVATEQPLPLGSRTQFSLSVPTNVVPLELRGEVVWTRTGGMGVRIIAPNERYETYVERLIQDSERL